MCSTVIARYDYKVCISPGLNESFTESINNMYTLIRAGMLRDKLIKHVIVMVDYTANTVQ